jgi:hypothetical protein
LPAPDLADLVEPVRGHGAVVVVQLLARLHCLLLRLRPLPAQTQNLGTVDAACSGEARDVEAIAPAVGGVRPLRRPAAVPERLAGVDGDAVDDPRGERVELPARRGRRRLVEDREPIGDVPRPDPDRALEDERRRLETAVAESRGELARPLETLPRAVELAQVDGLHPANECEMAVLDAFKRVGEQPLSPRDPAARHRQRSAEAVVHREDAREHRGPPGLLRVHERGIRLLAQPDRLVEATGPPGGIREALEVFRG